MKLKAKLDSPSTKGRVGWLKRMLQNIDDEYRDMTYVTFRWVGKTDPLIFSIREIFEWKRIPDYFPKSAVANFEVRMIYGESSSFQSPSKFILELEHLASLFYLQVGEKLKKWVPTPPKLDHAKDIGAENLKHH